MEPKAEILYGIHPVAEALKAGHRTIHAIYLAKTGGSKRLSGLIATAHARRIPVEKLGVARLASISGSDHHQGVGARVQPLPHTPLKSMLACGSAAQRPNFLLLLDSIVDPHNLGAIARSALCAGVTGIILPKDRCAGPTPAASKASAGALEHLAISRVTNLVQAMITLKKNGFWIIGLEGSAPQPIFDVDLIGPVALVLGSEEKGLRPLVRQTCDIAAGIPQNSRLNSLNAATAGAVALFEVVRQRGLQKG